MASDERTGSLSTRLTIRPPSTCTTTSAPPPPPAAADESENNDDINNNTTTADDSTAFVPPDASFLQGTWHVTHSTLPMWKSNRNVTITYTSLDHDASMLDDLVDDLVEYQPLNSDKHKSVAGVDTPDPHVPGAYNWRGRGWLRIASSHWEVLGYGDDDGGWVVTYFQKTFFTPAGIDIYSRRIGGLSEELLERITDALAAVEDEGVQKLVEGLFPIHHNW